MEEENTMTANNEPARSKKHARLHRSFLHLSNALKKLHGGGHATANDKSSSSSASFLSGCMHPRTNSFAFSRRRRRYATSDNGREHDDDGALAVDFRSLRLGTAATLANTGGSSSSTQDYYTDGGSEDVLPPPEPPAKAVACGGCGGVAVVTFSAAPYDDFRRSMREMVDAARREAEAAGSDDDAASRAPAVDWDLMEELLFCYLELNDRAVHKDILRAFTDTVAALRRRRGKGAAAKTRRTRRQRRRMASEHEDLNGDDTDEAVASS